MNEKKVLKFISFYLFVCYKKKKKMMIFYSEPTPPKKVKHKMNKILKKRNAKCEDKNIVFKHKSNKTYSQNKIKKIHYFFSTRKRHVFVGEGGT